MTVIKYCTLYIMIIIETSSRTGAFVTKQCMLVFLHYTFAFTYKTNRTLKSGPYFCLFQRRIIIYTLFIWWEFIPGLITATSAHEIILQDVFKYFLHIICIIHCNVHSASHCQWHVSVVTLSIKSSLQDFLGNLKRTS